MDKELEDAINEFKKLKAQRREEIIMEEIKDKIKWLNDRELEKFDGDYTISNPKNPKYIWALNRIWEYPEELEELYKELNKLYRELEKFDGDYTKRKRKDSGILYKLIYNYNKRRRLS